MASDGYAWIWVLMGEGGLHPAGVFTSREQAETWISQNGISGTLTRFPVDVPVLEWARRTGHFSPKFPSHESPKFKQQFSSAYLEHEHYQDGKLA